jgi:hypothetical protein
VSGSIQINESDSSTSEENEEQEGNDDIYELKSSDEDDSNNHLIENPFEQAEMMKIAAEKGMFILPDEEQNEETRLPVNRKNNNYSMFDYFQKK